MKKHIQYLKFLVLAIVFFAAAGIIEKRTLQPKDYVVDTLKVTKILHEKEDRLDTLLNDVYSKVKPLVSRPQPTFFKTLWDIDFKKLDEEGFVLLIYLDDSLRFWSDNSIEVSTRFSNSGLGNTVLNLNNAWYYVRNIHDRDLEIFGLIELCKDYSYQNEYLTNSFHKDFELPPNIEIKQFPLSYSHDILNKEGTYAFSLVPTNTIISRGKSGIYIGLAYFLGIAFLFLFLNKWFRYITIQHASPVLRIVLILSSLVFIRYLMLEYKFPLVLYSSSFFEPGHFAVSYLFPSLGDFFINSLLILFFVRSVFYVFRSGKLIRYFKKQSYVVRHLFSLGILILVIFFFNYVIQLLESLVINSSIPLQAYKVLELNLYSIMAYTIFGILFSVLIITIDRIVFITKQILSISHHLMSVALVMIIYSAIVLAFRMNLSADSLIYFWVLILVIVYVHYQRRKYHYSLYAVLIIIGAVYITLFVNNTIRSKDEGKSRVLISKLINERDRVAEHLFLKIEQDLKADEELKGNIEHYDNTQIDKIHDFLKKNYFSGYFSKYELNFVVCGDNYEGSNSLQNCSNYYSNIIDEFGDKIENTNFYYLDNHNGRVSYQGSVNYDAGDSPFKFTLYLLLDSKLLTHEIGYPDLLIEGKTDKKSPLSEYSYAKYQDGQLVTRSGDFPYDLNDKVFETDSSGYFTLHSADYEHYIYQLNNNRVVLTKARVKSYDLVIAFSYIFVFFNILLLISLAISNLPSLWQQIQLNFENKLLFAMLFILLISFAMVTAGTVYYNSSQFEEKHYTNINEKLESVIKNLEMEEEKGFITDSILSSPNSFSLGELLRKLSTIYYTDINLYDHRGKLISSSRPEIFSRGLIGTLMDPEAYRQMYINEKIRFIQNENIGKLQYSSAYALFTNIDINKPVFVNLPYFTKPAELRKEVSNLVVAIVNLYVVLFIIAALVSFFLANKITQPLRMLQSKFQKIELGKQSEQIVYNKRDEVGALVEEYNRMVIKLAESVELLAKTERESAWREMAKQIAHEIKNPLTPMKLSVQFLQRTWQNKDDNFEKKFNKSTQTLIDQIKTLTNIANEFSNFAKMPKPKRELVDLAVRIEHTVNLFGNTENMVIDSNVEQFDHLYIIADKEQISRVLTNLTKNAIQAIPAEREGHIKLMVEKNETTVLVKVIDNGTGITDDQKEKLFTPSFTTKSSGMGMGLPIVKDIIESAEGKIWFETELNKGSTFFMDFPLAKKEDIKKLQEEGDE